MGGHRGLGELECVRCVCVGEVGHLRVCTFSNKTSQEAFNILKEELSDIFEGKVSPLPHV